MYDGCLSFLMIIYCVVSVDSMMVVGGLAVRAWVRSAMAKADVYTHHRSRVMDDSWMTHG